MFRFLLGNRRLFFLLLFFLLAIFLLSPGLQRVSLPFLEKPIMHVVSGIEMIFASAFQGIDSLWEGYVDLTGVKRENDRLRREIERLTAENLRLQELHYTNRRLESLLGFIQTSPYRLSAAQVVGRDPTNWYRTVLINKGARQGLAVDMGVITPSGVVGRVVKVGPSLSQVLLLLDRNSAVAAVVERTRDEGIVEGEGEGLVSMKYLPLTAQVRVGDRILSSGLAGFFPKGLVIGTVTGVFKHDTDLYQRLQVSPIVDFSKLEEVLVITALPLPGSGSPDSEERP